MCDCYQAKCERCERLIPVHIEDFCTPRDNVKVFCQHHIPKDLPCTIEELQPENNRIPAELRGLKKVAFHIVDRENYNYMIEIRPFLKQDNVVVLDFYQSRRLSQYKHPSTWASLNTACKSKVTQWQFKQ